MNKPNLKNKISAFSAAIAVFFALLIFASAQTPEKSINILIQYNAGSIYDMDDDGIEDANGVIDFSVKNTKFGWNADQSKLCTRWDVYSLESNAQNEVCYGNNECCGLINLASNRNNWDEIFYLTYGMLGSTKNNIVSAQVVYANYSLDAGEPYSDISYSSWIGLPAEFESQKFSQALASFNDFGLAISSPEQELQSGEIIYLNLSTNYTAQVNFSLNNGPVIILGNGTSFNYLLQGQLNYSIFANGQYNVSVGMGNSSDSAQVYYLFGVNDTIPPILSINLTNNSIISAFNPSIDLRIESSEFAYASYKINSNPYSLADIGANKSKTISLNTIDGQNTLVINYSDYHGNYKSLNYTFAFYAGSCSDAVQNADESGVDCGGRCSSCISFNASTDKQAYNWSDNIFLTVVSRANSSVNVTITRQGVAVYKRTFVPVFANAPILETRVITNASALGNYTVSAIMSYLNLTETRNSAFQVVNPTEVPITLAVNTNDSDIIENDDVQFSATIDGNISAVSYKWDLNNDGSIESTSAEPVLKFPSNGTFTMNLTVTDSRWNQSVSRAIKVENIYAVRVVVRDNETGGAIQNSEVEFNDIKINTTSDGVSTFYEKEGRYDLVVRNLGYYTFSNKTSINQDMDVEVYLAKGDFEAPIIELIAPEDGFNTSRTNITFTYKAVDKGQMTCRLQISTSSGPWTSIDDDLVEPGTEYFFGIINLANASHEWRIQCTDKMGNTNASAARKLTIDSTIVDNSLSVNLDEQDQLDGALMAEIDSLLNSVDGWSPDEKEAAEAMQLKKQYEKAKVTIQRTNRDLHALKFRKLNDTELQVETQKTLDRINDIRNSTPRKFIIVEKNDYVKYPSKDDVSNVLNFMLNQSKTKLGKKDFANLVAENFKHQSLITVTTKYKVIDVEYLSGDVKTITLLQKSVSAKSSKNAELDYLEVIPKNIAGNVKDAIFLFDYEVVNPDPIIRINIDNVREYSYYFEKRVSIEEAQKAKSMLLSKNFKEQDAGLLTGFSIFGNFSRGLVKTANARLIAEVAIIAVLLLVFLYYQVGGMERFAHLLDSETKQRLKEMDYLFEKVSGYLGQKKYQESKMIYAEIQSVYRGLPKDARKKFYSKIVEIHNSIDIVYMDSLLKQATDEIMRSNRQEAISIYNQLNELYKKVPKEFKANVFERCTELNKRLSAK